MRPAHCAHWRRGSLAGSASSEAQRAADLQAINQAFAKGVADIAGSNHDVAAAALRLIIMDMAGTTVAVTDEVPAAMEEAFGLSGLSLPAEALAAVRGRTKRQVVSELLGAMHPDAIAREQLAERVHDAFRSALRRRITGRVAEVPGAGETLGWLRDQGMAIVLTTGFDRELAEMILESLGWGSERVNALVSADDVREGRPAPDMILRAMEITGIDDPACVAVVGDTTADLQAAHNAGVRISIGVLSGAHDRQRLMAEPHTVLLDSVADLRTWLFAGIELR
jgi:phosphonatase-like hydrolase